MAKIELESEEIWAVVDAGLIALGYVKDRSHEVSFDEGMWSKSDRDDFTMEIDGPGTYKVPSRKATPSLPQPREVIFKNYSAGEWKKDEAALPTMVIPDPKPVTEKPRLHRGLMAFAISTAVAGLIYNALLYAIR